MLASDNGRRDRTVFDCREAGAHTTAAGDGHAHEWLAEPWQAWQWIEIARWATIDTSACPEGTPSLGPIGLPPQTDTPPAGDPPDEPPTTTPGCGSDCGPSEDPTTPEGPAGGETDNSDNTEGTADTDDADTDDADTVTWGDFSFSVALSKDGTMTVTPIDPPATPQAQAENDNEDGGNDGATSGGSTSGGAPSDGVPGGYNW